MYTVYMFIHLMKVLAQKIHCYINHLKKRRKKKSTATKSHLAVSREENYNINFTMFSTQILRSFVIWPEAEHPLNLGMKVYDA